MLKLLADENFDNQIVRGLLRRNPKLDIVRVQEVGLSGSDDPKILAWASETDRVLLTHVTQKPKKVSETAIPSEIAAKP